METDVSIPGGPDGSQTTENPQAVDRETGEEEDESSQGLPQRTTQALKRLTYGSPGKPMYLSSNQITSLTDGVFVNLRSLNRLDLSSNQITSLTDGGFAILTCSSWLLLILFSNQITSLTDGAFANLTCSPKLYLYLSSNQITSLTDGVFADLTYMYGL
ncbi:hypothetical protein ACROYT_G026126 [Oculina patagonica]